MDSPVKRNAWSAAVALASGNRAMAEQLFSQAEMAVLRRLVCRMLPDGEDGYWHLVAEEITQ